MDLSFPKRVRVDIGNGFKVTGREIRVTMDDEELLVLHTAMELARQQIKELIPGFDFVVDETWRELDEMAIELGFKRITCYPIEYQLYIPGIL